MRRKQGKSRANGDGDYIPQALLQISAIKAWSFATRGYSKREGGEDTSATLEWNYALGLRESVKTETQTQKLVFQWERF
ncbi:hypothetical protein KUL49_37810 [Alteromonas sp. KUL49]|nr:hypothetical protein KUL49_37810 [Alteromonas sp. KUL49]